MVTPLMITESVLLPYSTNIKGAGRRRGGGQDGGQGGGRRRGWRGGRGGGWVEVKEEGGKEGEDREDRVKGGEEDG